MQCLPVHVLMVADVPTPGQEQSMQLLSLAVQGPEQACPAPGMSNMQVCPPVLALPATSPFILPRASTTQGWGDLHQAQMAADT